MGAMTVEQIVRAVEQLSPEEREALIERLRATQLAKAHVHPELDLLVFDVGPWPDGLTLRREDEYGDDER